MSVIVSMLRAKTAASFPYLAMHQVLAKCYEFLFPADSLGHGDFGAVSTSDSLGWGEEEGPDDTGAFCWKG